MVDTFYIWASSQPVWLQVFIGLALFFVGLPLCALLFYLALRVFAAIVEVLTPFVVLAWDLFLFVGLPGLAILIAWSSVEQPSTYIAFEIGDLLSLAPKHLLQLTLWVQAAATLLVVVALLAVAFAISSRFRAWVLSRIAEFRRRRSTGSNAHRDEA